MYATHTRKLWPLLTAGILAALSLSGCQSSLSPDGQTAVTLSEVAHSIVSAKYCYAAHESRLHQNDRCKRFALCLVLTVRFRSLAPWGKLFQLFI